MTPIEPDETFYDDEEGDRDDPEEDAIEECGQVPQGGCLMAGTEFCDFECPFRDIDLFEDDGEIE